MKYLFSSRLSSALVLLAVITLQLLFSGESFGQVIPPAASSGKTVQINDTEDSFTALEIELTFAFAYKQIEQVCGPHKDKDLRFTAEQLTEIIYGLMARPYKTCVHYLRIRAI